MTPQRKTIPLPVYMKSLPIDKRGYVVPWFVDWINGEPEFRAMDKAKLIRAVKEKRCWVCGTHMGIYRVFVAGPMCGINRTTSEPPCHRDCAEWSAINCPFLSNPKMVRREDEIMSNDKLVENAAGIAITRNPGVTMLWFTRNYQIFRVSNGVLFQMGEPERVDWYCEGRIATRDEVLHSVDTGLPSLELIARQEPGGLVALQGARARFERWIPK